MRKIMTLGAVLTILAMPVGAQANSGGHSTSDTGIGKGNGLTDTGIGKGSGTSGTGIGKGGPGAAGSSPPPPPPPPPPPGSGPGDGTTNTGIGRGNPHASVVHCRVTDVSGHSFTCRAHGKTYVFHVMHNRTLRHVKVGRHVRVRMHFHHHRHYADRVTVLR